MTQETRKKWKRAFEQFDVKRTGAIDAEELKSVMTKLKMVPAAGEIEAMIAAVDHDDDQTIDYEEFELMMVAAGRGQKGVGFAHVVERQIRMSDVVSLISQECSSFVENFMRREMHAYQDLPSGGQVSEAPQAWYDIHRKFCEEAELTMQSVLVLWGVLSQQKFESDFLDAAASTNLLESFLKFMDYDEYIKKMSMYVHDQADERPELPISRPTTPHAHNKTQRRIAELDRELFMVDIRRNELLAERRRLIGASVDPVTTASLKRELESLRWKEDVGID